jgi:5'-AMP-activated protein kinase catalytic alpha subunit
MKRFTIEQVRRHDFIRFAGKMPIPVGINTKERGFIIDVDEDIIDILHDMEVEREEARQMVKNNKHNCITATYYLLHSKRLRDPVRATRSLNTNSPAKAITSPLV